MMKPLITVTSFLLFYSCLAVGAGDAFAFNQDLGRGINLGNTFEAPSEDAWGNPLCPEFLPKIAELGFSHVRIPINWETDQRSEGEPPYTISAGFLESIQRVVDQALNLDLRVIINMHHHHALLGDPVGQRERFLAQWGQISEFFAGYPDRLLFEVFNEPHGKFTPELWNEFLADALTVIREKNPTRMVVIGTAEWGGIGGLTKLVIPQDDRLIVTVHYYLPFLFTHQGASWSSDPRVRDAVGTEWRATEEERAAVAADVQTIAAFGQANNVPIHIGEFGAYSRADLASRARWTSFVARAFEEAGFSWAYWEFSSGFGIYDRSAGEFIQPLVEALLPRE
jgi:aryl-phospho-beta-D-glucosidase BglC (GH1 family)